MSVHITDTDGDRVLFVEQTGNTSRSIIVQYDTHDCGSAYYHRFELSDLERKALIQALSLPTAMPAPECFHGDHVPGCEHQAPAEDIWAVDWFKVGLAVLGMDKPDHRFDPEPAAYRESVQAAHEPSCPAFHGWAECDCGAEPELGSDRLNP